MSDFFSFLFFVSLHAISRGLGDAHVDYYCAAKQNKQILHKQYRLSCCALIRIAEKNFSFAIY